MLAEKVSNLKRNHNKKLLNSYKKENWNYFLGNKIDNESNNSVRISKKMTKLIKDKNNEKNLIIFKRDKVIFEKLKGANQKNLKKLISNNISLITQMEKNHNTTFVNIIRAQSIRKKLRILRSRRFLETLIKKDRRELEYLLKKHSLELKSAKKIHKTEMNDLNLRQISNFVRTQSEHDKLKNQNSADRYPVHENAHLIENNRLKLKIFIPKLELRKKQNDHINSLRKNQLNIMHQVRVKQFDELEKYRRKESFENALMDRDEQDLVNDLRTAQDNKVQATRIKQEDMAQRLRIKQDGKIQDLMMTVEDELSDKQMALVYAK